MDLGLYLRVLWRFRLLVLVGVVLGFALAAFSYVRVGVEDGSVELSYRQSERWASFATVFVTQEGFPLGRSVYDESLPVTPNNAPNTGNGQSDSQAYVPRYNDPTRFSSYAQLYARIAGSDLLRRQMTGRRPLRGSVSATAGTDPRNPGIILPLVEIQALAPTADGAQDTAARATNALLAYVKRQQTANEIDESKRIILRVLNDASPPTLIESRSLTRPVFLFLAVMIAVTALAFLLENVRPAVPTTAPADAELEARTESRRSA